MNLKKKKVIHDLNNIAQKVMFYGHEESFLTCNEVRKMFYKYSIVTDSYNQSVFRASCDNQETYTGYKIYCFDGEKLKKIRLDALTHFKNRILSGELDYLFI